MVPPAGWSLSKPSSVTPDLSLREEELLEVRRSGASITRSLGWLGRGDSLMRRSNLARSLALWSRKSPERMPLETAESKLLFSESGLVAGLSRPRPRPRLVCRFRLVAHDSALAENVRMLRC